MLTAQRFQIIIAVFYFLMLLIRFSFNIVYATLHLISISVKQWLCMHTCTYCSLYWKCILTCAVCWCECVSINKSIAINFHSGIHPFMDPLCRAAKLCTCYRYINESKALMCIWMHLYHTVVCFTSARKSKFIHKNVVKQIKAK